MTKSKMRWMLIGGTVLFLFALAAAWKWTPLREWADPDRLNEMVETYRSSWIAFPLVIAVFVLAELLMFPVLVLIFACGLAFGPLLGPIYAMSGAVASAILPFFAGRWIGKKKIELWGGALARKLTKTLKKKGVIAVFLVRKIPAPYTPVNLVCGASGITFLDFLVGTVLGMITGVILITVLGSQMLEILSDPKPGQIAVAFGILLAATGLALFAQHLINRHVEVQS